MVPPLASIHGDRPEATEYRGAAEELQTVWVALRASMRAEDEGYVSQRVGITALERIVMLNVYVAVLVLVGWYVFFAGEPLTDTLVRNWRKMFPGPAQLINLYGPTETTLAKCFYRVPPEEQLQPATQPVG